MGIACPLIMEAALGDDVQEALFRSGVSGHLITAWHAQEHSRAVFHRRHRVQSPRLPKQAAHAAGQFMQELSVVDARLQFPGWCEGFTLIHDYCLVAPEDIPARALPALCVAIQRIVLKSGDANAVPSPAFMDLSRSFEKKLQILGFDDVERCSYEDVNAMERKVLKAMRWKVGVPSAYSWLSLLHTRIHILTKGHLNMWVAELWNGALNDCQKLLEQSCPGFVELPPPRRLANGLLCAGLVRTGLLPGTAFLPETNAAGKGAPELVGREPRARFPTHHSQALYDILRVSTGADVATLHMDLCEVTARLQGDSVFLPARFGVDAGESHEQEDAHAAETWAEE